MTFRSLFRITLICGSLCACVNQYQSPGGEIESTKEGTSTEPPSGTSDEPSEATRPSSEAKDTSDETKPTSSEGSGTCEDQTCVSATDCCKGYQCAFDPERSKVVRYCQPG